MTTTRMIVVGVLSAVLATAGCSKKSKTEKKQADDHNAAAPMSDDIRGMLAMMPFDSEAVVSVDFAALRKTAVYAEHAGQLKGLAASQLEFISKLCDVDPVDVIGNVIFAGKGKTKTGDVTALVRDLPKDKVMDCLTKGAATPPDGFLISVDGDYAMIEMVPKKKAESEDDKPADMAPPPPPADPIVTADAGAGSGTGTASGSAAKPNPSVAMKFLDDHTVLVARRKGHAVTGAELDTIAAGKEGKSLTESNEFMALIDATDTDAPIWFVVAGSAPMLKAVAKYVRFVAAFGSIRAGDGVDLDVTSRMQDDEAVKEFSSLMIHLFDNLKKSTLRDAVGPNQVSVTGRDVNITLHESGAQLTLLSQKGQELLMALLGAVLGQ